MERTIEQINVWYTSWANYFQMTQYPSQLHKIEAHIRRRLRSRFIGQHKRRSHLARKLIKLGATPKATHKNVYAKQGRWALSISQPSHQAWSNEWFTKRGLKVYSDRKLEHWFGIKQWVKLA